jgi:putative PEP-CTERM system histidine kinase
MIAAGANLPAIAGYALGLVGFLAFLLQLLLRWRGGEYARLLLYAVLASCFWEASGLAFLVWESPWAWLSYQLADGIRVSAWLGFVVSLLLTSTPKKSDSRRYASPGLIVLLVGAAAIGLWSWLAPLPLPGTNVSATGDSSVGLGLWLAVSILGLVVTEQLFRNTAESSRWAIKPLCVGLGGAFGFDLFLYSDGLLLRHLDYGIWSAQGFAQALVIPFIMVAVARNRHWTIDIAISRRAVFHSTSILLSGIYLLVVAGAGYYVRYVGGSWGGIVQAAFLFAALMVLTALFSSGTVRAKLKVLVNKHFFPYRYDYREEWLRVTDLLSTTTPGMELRERCIRALAELVESPAGALWLKRGEQIIQSGRWNMPHVVETELVSGELSRFLANTKWLISVPELSAQADTYQGLQTPSWLEKLPSAWIIVPLLSGADLIGFVLLATPRTPIDLNWEVRDLLKTAARQAASFLSQMQASEDLLEAKKFEAFNRMSAFVVHDLKNLVAQLSLMLKNARRHRDNPQFQQDMLATVEHAVARMNGLLVQLRSGAAPVTNPGIVDLEPIALRIREAKSAEGRAILLDIGRDVHAVGHEERLERVIGHLVQNALDATDSAGSVALRVYRDGAFAVAEVWDNGAGMSEQFVRDELFKPFRTTKSGGMGIGVYESSQYVTELGGRLSVESSPGVGTCMRVYLPGQTETAGALADQRDVA